MKRYGSVEEEVVFHPNLSLNAKGLYAIIAVYCGDKTYAWPSVDTLMEMSGMSRPTVQRLLRELKDAGCISRSFEPKSNRTFTHKLHVIET